MQKIKNILFYSWWINFWVIILIVVAMWEKPMLRFIGPMAFIAFICYAFYAMLVTKPNTHDLGDHLTGKCGCSETKESSTPDTKSDAGKTTEVS